MSTTASINWKLAFEMEHVQHEKARQELEKLRESYEMLFRAMEESRLDGFDLHRWLQEHIIWSLETFGDGARTEGLCKHIEKECNEVRTNPNDIMEWIDIIILACDGAWRAGYSAREICLALQQKQLINQERQWIRTPEDTPTEHVK